MPPQRVQVGHPDVCSDIVTDLGDQSFQSVKLGDVVREGRGALVQMDQFRPAIPNAR